MAAELSGLIDISIVTMNPLKSMIQTELVGYGYIVGELGVEDHYKGAMQG